jgi:5'-3' exonuclease
MVSRNVTVRSTRADNKEIYDLNKVTEEWGVAPHQIPHVQAIMGDFTDSIQKLPTIGLKRASQL